MNRVGGRDRMKKRTRLETEVSGARAQYHVFYARVYACVTSSRLVTLRLNRLLRSRRADKRLTIVYAGRYVRFRSVFTQVLLRAWPMGGKNSPRFPSWRRDALRCRADARRSVPFRFFNWTRALSRGPTLFPFASH